MKVWFDQLLENVLEFNPVTIAILITMIVGGVLVLMLTRAKWTTRMLAMGALAIALSFILSAMPIGKMPQGGSVTLASGLPLMLYAYMFGPIAGICAGVIHGLLQLVQGAYIVHPIQFFLDYIFAFAVLGIAGLFVKRFTLGTIAANASRFVFHLISGAVFFGIYADPGQSIWVYSFIYNITYMLPEIVITAVIAFIIMKSPVRGTIERYKSRGI